MKVGARRGRTLAKDSVRPNPKSSIRYLDYECGERPHDVTMMAHCIQADCRHLTSQHLTIRFGYEQPGTKVMPWAWQIPPPLRKRYLKLAAALILRLLVAPIISMGDVAIADKV